MMVANSHGIDLLSFLKKQPSMTATQPSQAVAPLSSFLDQTSASEAKRAPLSEAQIHLLMLDWIDRGINCAIAGINVQSFGTNG